MKVLDEKLNIGKNLNYGQKIEIVIKNLDFTKRFCKNQKFW